MLDRTIESHGLRLRLTYNHELNRYKGRITNFNSIPIEIKKTINSDTIYGDTVNEILKEFYKITNYMIINDEV